MYIPKHFEQKDRAAAIAFMRQYPFATLVTSSGGRPVATHLPFHIVEQEEGLLLTCHMAKANPQWKDMQDVLVIFQGPHAYISPQHYEKAENVPTWNYIAVHAYGSAAIVTDEARGYAILEELMQQSEPAFLEQWAQLSPEYKQRLYRGIVPFEVRVTGLKAKHKMSQNKTKGERQRIIHALEAEEDGAAHDMARYMRQNAQDEAGARDKIN